MPHQALKIPSPHRDIQHHSDYETVWSYGKGKTSPTTSPESANTILIAMSWHYLFYLYPALAHCHLHTKLLMPDDATDNSKRTPRDAVLSMWSISTGGYCSHG